jgi:hypothetical protein
VAKRSFFELLESVPPDDMCLHLTKMVKEVPEEAGVALDDLALEIARRYATNAYTYDTADVLANAIFGAMSTSPFFEEHFDSTSLAFQVYIAFDEGEYLHPGDASSVIPEEKYTKPMIREILERYP